VISHFLLIEIGNFGLIRASGGRVRNFSAEACETRRVAVLLTLRVIDCELDGTFDRKLESAGLPPLARLATTTLQINVGKVCNQACLHCHVEAGPARTESMTRDTAARVMKLLDASPAIDTVDITGGAPELNPSFRWLVEESRHAGRRVIDRCNLTILLEPGQEDLADFLARHRVEITASFPCYTRENVDSQRGRGVFEKSIAALRRLNALGFGIDATLPLNLVYNPGGASRPPPQNALEADYKRHLREEYGIEFNQLFTLTNMPIRRFADFLERSGQTEPYHKLLVERFNPQTVDGLMCRSLVSAGWDGALYDCDFNQMLEIPMGHRVSIWDVESFEHMAGARISTARHCFGCTAGAGSSCGGALS
jgi:radical SAM/Cys-rich protein